MFISLPRYRRRNRIAGWSSPPQHAKCRRDPQSNQHLSPSRSLLSCCRSTNISSSSTPIVAGAAKASSRRGRCTGSPPGPAALADFLTRGARSDSPTSLYRWRRLGELRRSLYCALRRNDYPPGLFCTQYHGLLSVGKQMKQRWWSFRSLGEHAEVGVLHGRRNLDPDAGASTIPHNRCLWRRWRRNWRRRSWRSGEDDAPPEHKGEHPRPRSERASAAAGVPRQRPTKEAQEAAQRR